MCSRATAAFLYICTEWGDVPGFLNYNVQTQGRMKVISIWQIILYSNSEGQSEAFSITGHKLSGVLIFH